MKKVVLLMLVITLSLSPLYSKAEESNQIGDNVFYTVENETVHIYGSGSTYDYPPVAGGFNYSPFNTGRSDAKVVTRAIIDEGITLINRGLFYNADKLEYVSLPSTVEEIKFMAFGECDSLDTVDFAPGIKKIASQAFDHCPNLKNFNLPDSLETIGSSAFSSCGAESVTIPGSIKEFYGGAFNYSKNLKQIVILPGMEIYQGGASYTPVEQVVFPSTLTQINGVFYMCMELTTVVIPENVTQLTTRFNHAATVKFIGSELPEGYVPNHFYNETYILNWTPFTVDEIPSWTNNPVNNVSVTLDETNPLTVTKYASGEHDKDYFRSGGGTEFTGNQTFSWGLDGSDTYTLYSCDIGGNETTKIVNLEYVDINSPAITTTDTGGSVSITAVDE